MTKEDRARLVQLEAVEAILFCNGKERGGEILRISNHPSRPGGVRVVTDPEVANCIACTVRPYSERHVAIEIKDGELTTVRQPEWLS